MLWDGMSFDIGAVHVQVLGPPRDFPTNFHDDQKWMASKYEVEVYPSSKTISVPMTNDSSICLKFTWGKSVFLTCGDLSYSGEKMTLSTHEEDLKATLAKVNHHGNYTSSIPEWIKAVRPQAVVAMKDKD